MDSIGESEEVKAELTAIIHPAPEGGYWAVCPEVPGANGQGESIEEAQDNLKEAVRLVLEDRLAEMQRSLPKNAIRTIISIG